MTTLWFARENGSGLLGTGYGLGDALKGGGGYTATPGEALAAAMTPSGIGS